MKRLRAYKLARDHSRGAVAGSSAQQTPQAPGGGEGSPVSDERCAYDPWSADVLKFKGPTLPPIPTKRDWKDTEPGERKCVNLRRLPLAEIDALGWRTFSDLQGSMSRRTVAGLFVLAYNLTSTDGRACFGDVHPDLIDIHNVVELQDVEARVVISSNPARGFAASGGGGGTAREVQIRCWAYSFLACAYMRLFTKPAEYFSRTAGRLIAGFRSFYGVALPFRDFLPEPPALFLVKCNLEQELLKNTFYNLLYAGEACPNGKDLKEFLFTTHVALAGLHPYSLFVRCAEALEVTVARLVAATRGMLRKHENETVDAVEEVYVNLACNPAEDYRLVMWRYARIFDSEFLNHLQTKRCQLFARVMAQLLTLAAPVGEADGVLKITQISGMSKESETVARLRAQRIYEVVESMKSPQHKG